MTLCSPCPHHLLRHPVSWKSNYVLGSLVILGFRNIWYQSFWFYLYLSFIICVACVFLNSFLFRIFFRLRVFLHSFLSCALGVLHTKTKKEVSYFSFSLSLSVVLFGKIKKIRTTARVSRFHHFARVSRRLLGFPAAQYRFFMVSNSFLRSWGWLFP